MGFWEWFKNLPIFSGMPPSRIKQYQNYFFLYTEDSPDQTNTEYNSINANKMRLDDGTAVAQNNPEWNTTRANHTMSMPFSIVIDEMRVLTGAVPGAGAQTWTFTLMDGASATDVAVTIDSSGTSGSWTTGGVEIEVADQLSIRCEPANTPASNALFVAIIIFWHKGV